MDAACLDFRALLANQLTKYALDFPNAVGLWGENAAVWQLSIGERFGMICAFVGPDNPASSDWTRRELAWVPEQTKLVPDIA